MDTMPTELVPLLVWAATGRGAGWLSFKTVELLYEFIEGWSARQKRLLSSCLSVAIAFGAYMLLAWLGELATLPVNGGELPRTPQEWLGVAVAIMFAAWGAQDDHARVYLSPGRRGAPRAVAH